MSRFRSLSLLPLFWPLAAGALTERLSDPQTGLSSWRLAQADFHLELLQLLPDYVRAVYGARGLPAAAVEEVAGYCVFGSVARNAGDRPLTYDSSGWRYRAQGSDAWRPLRTKSDWLAAWRARGIHFGWTLLPTAQTFNPGDWGQGFLTFDLPPGTRFDLRYTWTRDGRPGSALLEGLVCAGAPTGAAAQEAAP